MDINTSDTIIKVAKIIAGTIIGSIILLKLKINCKEL